MHYALLVYNEAGRMESLSARQQGAIFEEYAAIDDAPGVVGATRLKDADVATTVRVENFKTLVTDGPFADTKEVFAGWFLIEADDIDAAIAIAERIPAARLGGCVEVRPVME